MKFSKVSSGVFFKYALTLVWVVFTAALATWWIIFNLRQIEKLNSLNLEPAFEIARHQRMLLAEGATLVVLLVLGGMALLFYIRKEKGRADEVNQFFAVFTHEIKTSIASLRLQVESLAEDLGESSHQVLVGRLVQDTARLEVQLENSLFLARGQEDTLFFEKIVFSKVLSLVSHHWPWVKIQVDRNFWINGDARVFETILKNVIQNAVHHGKASQVFVGAREIRPGWIEITFSDDGSGFQGNEKKLGEPFYRHSSTSGSGLGLFIISEMVHRLSGKITNLTGGARVQIRMELEGGLV